MISIQIDSGWLTIWLFTYLSMANLRIPVAIMLWKTSGENVEMMIISDTVPWIINGNNYD